MIQEAISKLIDRVPLSREEAASTMVEIMSGEATHAQIGAFITALRFFGETAELIAGCAETMRSNATSILCNDPNAIDLVGTGGDCSNTFNISTTAAFVVAGAGVTVAKHGSYGVSSRCGSANVLSELGINLAAEPKRMEAALNEIGMAFLFAPALHPAMKHVVAPRKELGVRSIFNILGPLCNPAKVKNGVLGVFSKALLPLISEACSQLGATRLFVVHGNDGLDELTTTTQTSVVEINQGQMRAYEISPTDLGLSIVNPADLSGGDPTENAEITRAILRGKVGARRDIVLLNATYAILASGKVASLEEGLEAARTSIDSGAAYRKLKALADFY